MPHLEHEKKRAAKALLFVMLGLFLGMLLFPFAHEIGHYSFAYIFNTSSINRFEFNIDKAIIPSFETGAAHSVTYNDPVFGVFSPWQAVLVSMAGLLFDILILIVVIAVLFHYSDDTINKKSEITKRVQAKQPKKCKYKDIIFPLSFGLFISFFPAILAWLGDGVLLFSGININPELPIKAVLVVLTLVWFFLGMRFARLFNTIYDITGAMKKGRVSRALAR